MPLDIPGEPKGADPPHTPTWSPDGRRLAFSAQLSDSSFIGIYATSSGRKRLLRWPDGGTRARWYEAYHPTWSPSGLIGFSAGWLTCGKAGCRWEGEYIAAISSTSLGAPKAVTAPRRNVFDRDPAWSPDGDTIAFVRSYGDSSKGIHLVGADGDGLHALTPGYRPSWSPDSRQIAYDWQNSIYIIGADGSSRRRLGDGSDPSWSPDGRAILFTATHGTQLAIWTMHPDGSNRTLLVRRGGSDLGWRSG